MRRPNYRRLLRWTLILTVATVALLAILFVVNGLLLAHRETPFSAETGHPARTLGDSPEDDRTIKILSYNVAKGFAYKKGITFDSVDNVRERLDEIAALIRIEQPDLVFLQEAIFQCHRCPFDQVAYLAEQGGMHVWAGGENYNFGLPFYRIVGGNAILSRHPLTLESNPPLPGAKPFYVTKNNRRQLWCTAMLAGQEILLASIHNDSFSKSNNLAQMEVLLDYVGDRPAILAGDFNAYPDSPSIQLLRSTEHFTGEWNGPFTFSAKDPHQTIDFVFAPADWELLEHRVDPITPSDHLPVVSVFRAPAGEDSP